MITVTNMETRMIRTTLRYSALVGLAAGGAAACSQADAKGEGARDAGAPAAAAVTFDSARVISGATTVGAAPMFAVDG